MPRVKTASVQTSKIDLAEELSKSLPASSPLVFVSHDHRDADLAEAFSNLLTDSSGGVLQSFRSSDRRGTAGIEFGSEWYNAIMSKLGQATDVVALLTPHSLDRPWILYEAGVAKGKLNTTVLGIVVGLDLEKANSGPFAQFQNCGDDSDSLTKLVLQLIKRNPKAAPREEAVRRQVSVFMSTSEEIKKGRGSKATKPEPAVDTTSVAKIFEEVKVLVRDLPMRLESQIRDGVSERKSRRQREFTPVIFDELIHSSEFSGDATSATVMLMIATSLIRDELPWLFELAAGLHRAYESRDKHSIAAATTAFRVGIEQFGRRGLFERGRGLDKELYYFIRHLPEAMDTHLAAIRQAEKRKASSKEAVSEEG